MIYEEHFSLSLDFIIADVLATVYSYKQGRVTGGPLEILAGVPLKEAKEALASTYKFIKEVARLNSPPSGKICDKVELEEKKETRTELTFENRIGDLIMTAVYDKATRKVTGQISAFDLGWTSFKYHVGAFKRFLDLCSEIG